jgi:uncharacterized protein YfaS (alpha-2-macroglobulin family)
MEARIRFRRAETRGSLALIAAVAAALSSCGPSVYEIPELGPDDVAVAEFYPSDGTLEHGRSVSIRFTQDVAPEEAELNVRLDSPPASLDPPVAGFWKWTHRSALRFVPEEDFRPAATYEVIVDRDIAKSAGLRFRGKRAFSVVTDPLLVEREELYVRLEPGELRTYRIHGNIDFNLPVGPEELARHLRVEGERRGEIDVEIETEGSSRHHSFRTAPIDADEKDERAKVTVEGELRPLEGDIPMGESVEESRWIPSFRRLAIRRVRSDAQGDRPVVSVYLSHAVDPGEFESRLTLDPEVPGLRIDTRDRGREILLHGDWELSRSYSMTVSPDLVAENGMQLAREYRGGVFIEDLSPSLRIAGVGNYLSLRGEGAIAVETVNVEEIEITLDRVFANNLVPFLQREKLASTDWSPRAPLHDHAERIYRRLQTLDSHERNRRVVTPVDLREALRADSRGIFRLTVKTPGKPYRHASKLVIATDIGLVVKRAHREILVAAVSIADLTPLPGIEVEVFSRNNQIMRSARTDENGFAVFRGIGRGTPYEGHAGGLPFVITARRGGDLGFLEFSFEKRPTPVGDFDIGGAHRPRTGTRCFVYSDRGIYRPGDVARLAWITRDEDLRIPPEFPVTVQVKGRMSGRVFREERATTGKHGFAEWTLDLPEWMPTGEYYARILLDPETSLGSRRIRVEDFIPDRLKVNLDLLVGGEPAQLAAPGDAIELRVEATSLFGPPAPGRDADGRLRVAPIPIRLDDWESYTFGHADEEPAARNIPLGTRKTDEHGHADWKIEIPEFDDYHGWLRAEAEVEVTELGGGRVIGGRRSLVVSPVTHLIGLKRGGNEDPPESRYEEPGRPIPFRVVLVDLEGRPVKSSEAVATLFRRKWRTILEKDGARYRYVSHYDEERIEERRLDLPADATTVEFTVDRHGSYRLQVEDAGHGARSSLPFSVYGWGYAPWAMSAPEKVVLRLDREKYDPGEVAKVQIEAPFAGLLLLTVERDEVFTQRWVRLDSNSAVAEIPVEVAHEPNAYVVATLLRPLDSVEVHAPARAFGAVPLFVSHERARLDVQVEAPDELRPESPLPVRLRVPGADRSTQVTVAAVDEGILRITDFETPSPLEHYFQRRRLDVDSYDIWTRLLPEFAQVLRRSRPGGGLSRGEASIPGENLNPISVRRVKPVALWSGVLPAGPDWQTVELDVPEFSGSLRIMAVAAGDRRFGSAEHTTRVRDPIVLSPNLPRFLAPGDEIAVPVQVYNGITEATGESVDIAVTADLSGPVAWGPDAESRFQVPVAGGREELVTFRVQARDSIGRAVFEFRAGGGDEEASVRTELAVRPPRPRETRAWSGLAREGETGAARLSSDFHPGTQRAEVVVSTLPVAQVASGLEYLLRYPYGCIEQTVSSCFPLLYFPELASEVAPDVLGESGAEYFLLSGLDRVLAMHLSERGFSYWPGGSERESNPWATVYATHFLVEARRRELVVPDRVLDDALDYLTKVARSADSSPLRTWSEDRQRAVQAYAVYVLALAGRPERGVMERLRHLNADGLPASARYHLAGAYGLTDHAVRRDDLLPVSVAEGPESRETGFAFRSAARDDAILLDVLATVDPDHRLVFDLVIKLLSQTENGRWRNTQENAWAFLALGKLAASLGGTGISGLVLVDGEPAGEFGSDGLVISAEQEWAGREIEIVSNGPGPAYWSIVDEGVPRGVETRDVTNGLMLSREYFSMSGDPVDPASIPQGDVIVAKISLASQSGPVSNVVVADLVPAGLEIENPRLRRRGAPEWTAGQPALPVEYLDVRDDRLLLFTTAQPREHQFCYTLRAVTRGRFALPPVQAEAMYDPAVVAIRGAGEVRVVAAD